MNISMLGGSGTGPIKLIMGGLLTPVIVYLLSNRANGKVYVGQHRGFSLSKRWNKTLNNGHVNNHLTGAINKYGAASFSRKILCHATCQQELDLLEQFWIATYKSTDPRFGYNQQSGGRRWHGKYTPRLKQLISEGTRKAWARKSAKERWEHAFTAKIRWLMMNEQERTKMTAPMHKVPWNRGTGRKKGLKRGPHKNPCRNRQPHTEEHKKRIAEGVRRFHRNRRKETGSKG